MRTHRPGSDGLASGASHRPRVRVARVQVGARAECRTQGGGEPRLEREAGEGVAARIARGAAKLELDLQQPVVFRVPLAARDRARLDLPGPERHGEVGDRRVLGLAGAVRYDRRVTRALRELD